jgi:hypothetical protein
MRNKAKVEKVLSTLSQEDQNFATLYGPNALANRDMFMLARNVHYDIKNKSHDAAARNLMPLFAQAIEKNDFSGVRKFVELLDEWNSETSEIVKGSPALGFAMPFAKDPVGMMLLTCAEVPVRLSRGADTIAEDIANDMAGEVKIIRLETIGYTAKQILKLIEKKVRWFQCDIKTIRNRARELGVKLLPDKRGLRKGQKRNHVHRARRQRLDW